MGGWKGRLNVKTVHGEILFCLSHTRNISESFKVFGVPKGSSEVGE